MPEEKIITDKKTADECVRVPFATMSLPVLSRENAGLFHTALTPAEARRETTLTCMQQHHHAPFYSEIQLQI